MDFIYTDLCACVHSTLAILYLLFLAGYSAEWETGVLYNLANILNK
jgi:hypothetical protein